MDGIHINGLPHIKVSDLHGLQRLTLDAILGLTDLVQAMQGQIIGGSVADLAYAGIRSAISLAGSALDGLLSPVLAKPGAHPSSSEREAVLAALNGVLGDYLEQSGNPLAIPMRLRQNGRALALDRQALADILPQPGGRLLILVHGLCRSDLQWKRRGHEHGAALARDSGYTPLYLHYNSGRHISSNGRQFAMLMEELLRQAPAPPQRLALIGHSMGGLLIRSACHYAGQAEHAWLRHLRKVLFLGTPHHGAPLERGGNWLHGILGKSPYLAPLARLGRIRSAGITDLRFGNLIDEDWAGRDRFEHAQDLRHPVPLPRGVPCYTLAATTGKRIGDFSDRLLGDGLVPLASALGRHQEAAFDLHFPKSRRWIGYGMHHLDLLSRPEVYQKIRRWLA